MSIDEMFQQASRLKLRYETNRGMITVEDLWDLPLSLVDNLAIAISRDVAQAENAISFIAPTKNDDAKALLSLKFEIIKYIIGVRVAERDVAKDAADRRQKKTRLLELIAHKEDAALGEKSVEELRALAESL
jgi:hypothetical protein